MSMRLAFAASACAPATARFDVRNWDTDGHDLGSICDSRFAGTLKAVF